MTMNQKRVGGGLQEGNLNVQKGTFLKANNQRTALPFVPLGPPTGAYIFTNGLRLSFRKKVLTLEAVQANLGSWNRRTL